MKGHGEMPLFLSALAHRLRMYEADNGTGGAGNAPQQPATPSNGNPPPTTPPATGGEQGDDLPSDAEGLKRALAAERTQRRQFERQAKELEKYKLDTEQAAMTDAQKKDARIKELEAKTAQFEAREAEGVVTRAIEAAATTAGAKYPDVLARMIDRAQLTTNAEGQITNLTATMNGMRSRYPDLFRTNGGNGSADAGAGGQAAATSDMNTMLRRAAGRE